MHVVWVEFVIHEEHSDAFIVRVQQQAADSLELESECHVFDVCIGPDDPTCVALYEVYTDAAAFKLHLESAHFVAFDEQVKGWVQDKRVAQFARIGER
ncbi:MAG: antibiotic biosynthesis monooxygenase [Pseudomonadota bacterium]